MPAYKQASLGVSRMSKTTRFVDSPGQQDASVPLGLTAAKSGIPAGATAQWWMANRLAPALRCSNVLLLPLALAIIALQVTSDLLQLWFGMTERSLWLHYLLQWVWEPEKELMDKVAHFPLSLPLCMLSWCYEPFSYLLLGLLEHQNKYSACLLSCCNQCAENIDSRYGERVGKIRYRHLATAFDQINQLGLPSSANLLFCCEVGTDPTQ